MVDEQDKLLPIANVGRIMKQILPPRAKISKEAKQTMQECATEFISFVTSEASDKCHKENRKTVNGDDICWALSALGFDDYAGAIVRYLHKYREAEREKANQSNKVTSSQDKDEESNHKRDQTVVSEQQVETLTPLESRLLGKGKSPLTKPS
ncbi:nuclear transcription factor Y subunit B-4-like [Mangifera indica]|uniref:nuclear transcription factor Y subunit B-4-like n=1 Tax=Mangifera indica TaxID=29780 RepID=UPI001CFBA07C|nr:nuclear transcription factor Y subunit B-4-like [Mangifera indica]